nr:Chain A, Granulin [Opisthorchis viverrini]
CPDPVYTCRPGQTCCRGLHGYGCC